jgi:type VI protein secretion system component Hcp
VSEHTNEPTNELKAVPEQIAKPDELAAKDLEQVTGGGTATTTSSSTPKLYEALHNGTHIPKVIIEL